ncbi:MAG: hypothetical protein D6730_23515 [Bacteroidetes bacterium]|nr:MAG: hypothetical protein D6730_23515 [Bacteroidota bacterium]
MFGLPTEITTALIATLTTAMLFVIKELIDNWREQKASSEQKLEAFKTYTDPLLLASFTLYKRLMEIFERKRKFLMEIAPNNPYYQYRYISTLYRLAVVLGWMQTIRRELAGMELKDRNRYREVIDSIEGVREALAESQHMEGARLNYLADKWQIDISELDERDRSHLEAGIRQLIWDALGEEDVNYAYQLSEEAQGKLLLKVGHMICDMVEAYEPDEELILAHTKTAIRAISRTEAWIYRDWQQAIGDMMLLPVDRENSRRRFEIMGFQEFEDLYLHVLAEAEWKSDKKLPTRKKKNLAATARAAATDRWMERLDALFTNLDVVVDAKYDARVQQLKNLGTALIKLIQVLEDLDKGSDKVDPNELKRMHAFDRLNNPDCYPAKQPPPQEAEPLIETNKAATE